jgi:hypothetical protein
MKRGKRLAGQICSECPFLRLLLVEVRESERLLMRYKRALKEADRQNKLLMCSRGMVQ